MIKADMFCSRKSKPLRVNESWLMLLIFWAAGNPPGMGFAQSQPVLPPEEHPTSSASAHKNQSCTVRDALAEFLLRDMLPLL